MENILEVKNVTKKYSGFELKNISFVLPKGMIMGLIGENGAGKTTTIKTMLNVIGKDSGEVNLFGMDLNQNEEKIKQEIGVVLEDSFLSEYLKPKDISKIMRNFFPTWNEELYANYIEKFNLPLDKFSKEYSRGMKMKLKIATALAHQPKLLILDEPTAGLDPVARNDVLDIFQDFIEDGEHSVLVSSHITSDLERIADYITFINKGEIIFTKSKDELLEEYGIAKCKEEEFRKLNQCDYVKCKKNKYEYDVLIENKDEFRKKYNISIIDKPTIEEIMLIYIKGEK